MAFFAQVQPEPNIGGQIGQSIGQGLMSGAEMQMKQRANLQELMAKHAIAESESSAMKDLLISRGIPEDIASLYSQATEGGKTAILNNLLDLEQRGLLEKGTLTAPREKAGIPSSEELVQEKPSYEFPDLEKEKGLKPSEKIKRQDVREKTNIPIYNETNKTLRNLQLENLSLQRLEQINKSGKLPKGMGRFNVNLKSGELIAPFLASPESQLYVKTINDFTTKAKDSYGARVTNFELDRFMKRLPTLLNTEEGRNMILSQMRIINELNALDHESLRDVFDYYGVNKVNAQEAQKIARQKQKSKEDELLKEYKSLEGQLDKIPATQEPEKARRPLAEFMR